MGVPKAICAIKFNTQVRTIGLFSRSTIEGFFRVLGAALLVTRIFMGFLISCLLTQRRLRNPAPDINFPTSQEEGPFKSKVQDRNSQQLETCKLLKMAGATGLEPTASAVTESSEMSVRGSPHAILVELK